MATASSRPERPTFVQDEAALDAIPDELKARRQWVVWTFDWRVNKDGVGRWTKPPLQPRKVNGRRPHARTNDPATWGTYEEALEALRSDPKVDGIGYVFSPDDEYVGIDFDRCLRADGEIAEWAVRPLRRIGSTYHEVSPSGQGLKAVYRGTLPRKPDGRSGRRRGGYGEDGSGEIEAYDQERYFTFTGSAIGDRLEVGDADPDALLEFTAELDEGRPSRGREDAKGDAREATGRRGTERGRARGGPRPASVESLKPTLDALSDEDLLLWARHSKNGGKFSDLYDVEGHSGYHSASEADEALLVLLAFWTGGDPDRMERLFDGSVRGRSEKWQGRADYRRMSIDSAIRFNGGKAPDLKAWHIEDGVLKTKPKAPPNQPRWEGQDGDHRANGHQANGHHRGDGPPEEPAPRSGGPDSGKPSIILECLNPGDGLEKWTGLALTALETANDPPSLFQRAGVLARLRRADADGPIGVESLSTDALRGILDRAANWGEPRVAKKGGVFIKWGPPRMEVVRDFASLPGWDPRVIPYLETIVESPRFLPDGRLITKPGYHRDARLYYNPPAGLLDLGIPMKPKRSEVEAAKALIFDEYLCDFPFAERASKANALASMLLPFVRMMVDGASPLHVYEASTEGTGKGKCANACAYPSLARPLASTPQKEDEAEWRKAITAALMGGASHLFIDNMYNPRGWDDVLLPVDSGTLAMALTQPFWFDRILGGNTEARIKIQCTWMASGNNVEWSKELARRIVPIRLTTPVENPSERTGFKHDPLEDWAKENHRELLRACLVLCQHWIAEGRPSGKQTMGSYEHYARVMGGILEVAGVPGFLENRKTLTGKDRESTRWPALVLAWHRDRGSLATSAGQVYDLIFGEVKDGKRVGGEPELQVAFSEVVGDGKELSQKQKLGRAIAKQEDRVWAGLRIVRSDATTGNGSVLYRLVPPGDEAADNFDPARPY